ncbi:MAG: peptidoglycan DD-metalloendopeptidase family protein, partial [Acidimicrobiia bacterium]|nr:peptidoglycan DD-metalloendopeptidase family protein [Acidimicrobiia bacterium]
MPTTVTSLHAALVAPILAAMCLGLGGPLDGPVLRSFAPIGRYAGHWGVDIGVTAGAPVHSVGPGVVTFAGSVAGRRSITVSHGGRVRSSYSYLGHIAVAVGAAVGAGDVLGHAGS